MNFRFKKGKHRPRPLYWLRWFWWMIKPAEIKRQVIFTRDAKYWLRSADQMDWNKLFGISFSLSPHKNSARYGWRYNTESNKFELAAYCYSNGRRIMEKLCELQVGTAYQCHLLIADSDYRFRVYRVYDMAVMCSTEITKGHAKKSGYLLGPYFGGNQAAPDTLIIQLKKF